MHIKKLVFFLMLSLLASAALAVDEASVHKTAQKGTVALTFDDGPTVKYTPQILAILKKYHIKATFFMVGMNAEAHPEIVKMVLADGHAINSHSMTHPMLTKLNEKQLDREVGGPQVVIYNIIAKRPVCLRYPFGASNEHVRTVIREYGMVPVPMGWNSFDYERPGVDKIVSWVLENAHSGQVFLFHDGFDKREQTVAALPRIIEGIQKKGLGFSQICVN
ncbi:MAG TPA: polysaccharide deacetylase family protein [Gammaproteobacteria bacterium]|nr:polysaccharide deacetylase family protein [Gammaproteobacteria bacterium]